MEIVKKSGLIWIFSLLLQQVRSRLQHCWEKGGKQVKKKNTVTRQRNETLYCSL